MFSLLFMLFTDVLIGCSVGLFCTNEGEISVLGVIIGFGFANSRLFANTGIDSFDIEGSFVNNAPVSII